jgi:hypothetical protein
MYVVGSFTGTDGSEKFIIANPRNTGPSTLVGRGGDDELVGHDCDTPPAAALSPARRATNGPRSILDTRALTTKPGPAVAKVPHVLRIDGVLPRISA